MDPLHNSYRLRRELLPVLILLLSASLEAGQDKTRDKTQADKTQGNKTQEVQLTASAIADKQNTSVAIMTAAIEKQKASIQTQLAGASPADAFFSASWTTPPSIPVPTIIPPCSPMTEDDLKPLVAQNAKEQDVKPEVIRAVIRRESASYPCAVSYQGALGLMQLMPDVADRFKADPLDPKQNVAAGTKYLKTLLTHYGGDLKLALAAYNAGPERVDADKKVPDIPETTAYVDAILKDVEQNQAPQKGTVPNNGR